MNKHWLKMMGFKNKEEASEAMANRAKLGKGVPKKFNKLRDEPGYAKELRSRGTKKG
jgi:hypothetical protein